MSIVHRIRIVLLAVLLPFAVGSCVTVHTPEVTQALNDLKLIRIDSLTRAVGSGLITGVKDSLLNAKTTKQLDSLVGSLASTLVASAQDTLLDAKTRAKIDSTISGVVSILTGKKTRLGLDSLINAVGRSARLQVGLILQDVLGKKTQDNVAALLERAIGDSTKMRLDTLVNHLIGTYPQAYIHALLDTLNHGINNTSKEVKSTSSWIIWSLVAGIVVVMAVATWLYIQKRKVQKVSEVVTYAIHNIPERSAYDELTHRIQDEAQRQKVEPILQKILDEQGIRGAQSWKPPVQYKATT
ncbi:MAG: hypothetical protein JSS75_03100 [Bacteroidetes bacterium]|nr:hypothetical protein [Bacteroidota bacterium]